MTIPCPQVSWKDEQNPTLGFEYLYLSEDDYAVLPKGTVDATPLTVLGSASLILTMVFSPHFILCRSLWPGDALCAGRDHRTGKRYRSRELER